MRQDLLVHVPSGKIMIWTGKGKKRNSEVENTMNIKSERSPHCKLKERTEWSDFSHWVQMHAWLHSAERAGPTKSDFGKIVVTCVDQPALPGNDHDSCNVITGLFASTGAFLVCPLISFGCHLRHPGLINSVQMLSVFNVSIQSVRPFTWGHSPPECALRLISSTVFFLESWSDRDTNTGLIYLINATSKQKRTKMLLPNTLAHYWNCTNPLYIIIITPRQKGNENWNVVRLKKRVKICRCWLLAAFPVSPSFLF